MNPKLVIPHAPRAELGNPSAWQKLLATPERFSSKISHPARAKSWRPGSLHPNLSWTHYRTLLRVDIDSLIEADKTFTALLGKDPASRYQFIMESANQVGSEELDV